MSPSPSRPHQQRPYLHSIRIILFPSPSAFTRVCLLICYNFCPLPLPQSLLLVLHIRHIFLHLAFSMLILLFSDQGTAVKTSVQQSDHSSSTTYMFAVNRLRIFPLYVITAKRHYRYNGITALCLPSPRYYREIFPVSVVITVVTAVLPLFYYHVIL